VLKGAKNGTLCPGNECCPVEYRPVPTLTPPRELHIEFWLISHFLANSYRVPENFIALVLASGSNILLRPSTHSVDHCIQLAIQSAATHDSWPYPVHKPGISLRNGVGVVSEMLEEEKLSTRLQQSLDDRDRSR